MQRDKREPLHSHKSGVMFKGTVSEDDMLQFQFVHIDKTDLKPINSQVPPFFPPSITQSSKFPNLVNSRNSLFLLGLDKTTPTEWFDTIPLDCVQNALQVYSNKCTSHNIRLKCMWWGMRTGLYLGGTTTFPSTSLLLCWELETTKAKRECIVLADYWMATTTFTEKERSLLDHERAWSVT